MIDVRSYEASIFTNVRKNSDTLYTHSDFSACPLESIFVRNKNHSPADFSGAVMHIYENGYNLWVPMLFFMEYQCEFTVFRIGKRYLFFGNGYIVSHGTPFNVISRVGGHI